MLRSSDYADIDEADATAMIPVRITPEEHAAIKIAAARGNTTMTTLVRRALGTAGLLNSATETEDKE